MKISKKKIIIGACIAVILGGAGYVKIVGNTNKPKGTMVNTIPIEKKDIEDSILLKAPLEGTESIDVVSNLHYEVLQINVKEGDKVKKGQVLAVLDSEKLIEEITKAQDDLEKAKYDLNDRLNNGKDSLSAYKQTLAQTKATVSDKLKTSQEEYDKAIAALNEQKRIYDNVKSLHSQGAGTLEDLKKEENLLYERQRTVDSFDVVNGKVVANDSDLQTIKNAENAVNIEAKKTTATAADNKAIQILQKNLDTKRKDLEECQIKSSIDGTVTRVYSKVGRFADDAENGKSLPMFMIENIDKLQMKVNVSEFDIGKIKVGQNVVISADILNGEAVEGKVTRISPTGEEKTNTTGGTERVIPTEIEVIGTNPKLIAGITANAKIEIEKSLQTLVVPIEAIMTKDDGTSQVFKVTAENKIEIIPVELGIENDIEIEIKSDRLSDTDQVVIAPDFSLTEGMDVMTMGGVQTVN